MNSQHRQNARNVLLGRCIWFILDNYDVTPKFDEIITILDQKGKVVGQMNHEVRKYYLSSSLRARKRLVKEIARKAEFWRKERKSC